MSVGSNMSGQNSYSCFQLSDSSVTLLVPPAICVSSAIKSLGSCQFVEENTHTCPSVCAQRAVLPLASDSITD